MARMIRINAGAVQLTAALNDSPIADALWEKMVDECVGQGESSGCCEP